MDKLIKRPVLRYHGGKYLLATWIISHFPVHRVYVEPFGGAGSVLMRKKRCYAEVYNDKWEIVVNVFNVLRDPVSAAALEKNLRLTPFARTEFDKCGDDHINTLTDPVEKARLTILRSFAGFGSASTNAKHSTGFRADSKKSGTTPARDWARYPDHIQSFVERLAGVVIENREYKQVIDAHDSSNTLVYLDPPYMHVTRNMKRGNASYAFEMTDAEHTEMADYIKTKKSMFVISGYENDLYLDLFKNWKLVRRKTFADGANSRIECLWISPNCSNKNNQLGMFT